MGSISQGSLYFLDVNLSAFPNQNGRILASKVDGSGFREVVTRMKYMPDGIVADLENGHLYWTNMGASMSNPDDGSIQRCDLDGCNITTIVPPGTLHTPKQITLVRPKNDRPSLYWCDREGMRVMRCALDGAEVEILVQTGAGEKDRAEKANWCVGIAVDSDAGVMYWSQKGPSKGNQGKILRAPAYLPPDQSPEARTDIEILLDGLPEPIDLHISVPENTLYWTDRGDPPRGNTVNCLDLNLLSTDAGEKHKERILTRKLHEGIGLAVDEANKMMYFTDLAGGVYSARLDGSDKKKLFADIGDCTGIAYVPSQ
ncbi:low-density lipoprotein receptor YWTD [Phlyctema vagabunda]|uniref:Low-density lipoprotein receptor YWTD n=1 Tax=Phlyctema vagabunda TaxID=108571 RepID=A0ABR4PUH6_9HELO